MKDSKKVTKKSPAVKNDEKFMEEENDNRVIIFIAIAILVIIGTIIGLLVGCDKKTDDKDPVKPKDNIVVPDNNKKEEDKKEETKTTVIKKVTTKSNDNTNKTEEEETYVVSFNLLDEEIKCVMKLYSTKDAVKKAEEILKNGGNAIWKKK